MLTLGCSVPFYGLNALDLPAPFGLPPSVAMIVVPATGAGVLVAREEGRGGLRRWAGSLLDARLHPLILTVPAAQLLALALLPTDDPWPLGVAQAALVTGIFVLGAIPEELGWAAYATAPLQERLGVTGAGLLIGTAWAAWHVVPYLSMGRSWAWIAGQCAATVAIRVIMGHLAVAGTSTLAAVLFHAASNASLEIIPAAATSPREALVNGAAHRRRDAARRR